MPVLPAVPSTTVPPVSSRPSAIALRMMPSAARSFTDCPGLRNSHLPRISQPVASDARFSRTSGVLPMRSRTVRFIAAPVGLESLVEEAS